MYIYPLVLHWYALTYNLGFYKQNHREITEYDKVVTPSSVVLVSEVQCGPCSESANGIASIFISFPIFSKFPGFFCSQLSSGISVRVYLVSPDLNFCANDFSIRKQKVVTHKCKFEEALELPLLKKPLKTKVSNTRLTSYPYLK